MKKLRIVYVVLVWGFSLAANAKDLALFLGADLPLCQHMFDLYRKDFKEHGRVLFKEHKEFNSIDWERIIDKKSVSSRCFYREKSKFDIDNNKKNEFVVRVSGCLSGVISNNINVYNLGEKDNDTELDLSKENVKYELILAGSSYHLKELPAIKLRGQFEGKEVYPSITGTVLIEPFVYGGKTYISILGSPNSHVQNEWITISELTNNFSMKDICYFKEVN